MLPKIPTAKPNSSRAPRGSSTAPQKAAGLPSIGDGPSAATSLQAASSSVNPVSSSSFQNRSAVPRYPKHVEIGIIALVREEDLFRRTVEMQCDAEQAVISLNWQQIHASISQAAQRRSDRNLEALRQAASDQQQAVAQLLQTSLVAKSEATNTREHVQSILVHLQSDTRRELEALRAENLSLKCDVARQREEIGMQHAEIHALRDQLARRILRNSAESRYLQHMVQDEIQRASLSIESLRKDLHAKIDAAVLAFQKPSAYQTAVQALREHVASVQQLVQDQADSLHLLVDDIGARDRFFDLEGDGGTMHTNLPVMYRRQLQDTYTRDQLLNLIDVLSFEDGAVDSVGKAIRARQLAASSAQRRRNSAANDTLNAIASIAQ